MELATIEQAKRKGLLRTGDILDLTEFISKKKAILLESKEAGVNQIISACDTEFLWYYDWNSVTRNHVLIGVPTTATGLVLRGKRGFANGSTTLNKVVNYLYAYNEQGIYGRQISEKDYYGFGREDCEQKLCFENNMHKAVKIAYTATESICDVNDPTTHHESKVYGFKFIKPRTMDLQSPKSDNYLYKVSPVIGEKGDLVYTESEETICVPFFPILYGDLDKLLVDIDGNQNNPLKLYLPK